MTDFTPEQTEKLETYLNLLRKWQKTINLVSNSTLNDAWERHIHDSAQLSDHIPRGAHLLDIGSGGGFPALVLAIIRPDVTVTMVESDTRKCTFLQTVARETSTHVKVLNERIEDVPPHSSYDVITARAFACVEKILYLTRSFFIKNPELFCLLLKGENADEEIREARQIYDFSLEDTQSLTNTKSKILKIWNVSRETSF